MLNFSFSENIDRASPSTPKRQKITAGNGAYARLFVAKGITMAKKAKKAKLAALTTLPLDILLEIFGHMQPLDLLHLARTTKTLRRTLMQKNTISVWKSSLLNEPDLPQCPADMSHPAWINMAFDLHTCHNCLTRSIRPLPACWEAFVRLCGSCVKTCILSSSDDANFKVKEVFTCVAFTEIYDESESCYIPDKLEFEREFADSVDEDAFVALKKKEIHDRYILASECRIWADKQSQNRDEEAQKIRQARKNFILKKLRGLGWQDELAQLPATVYAIPFDAPKNIIVFADHPIVKQAKPLTDRLWKKLENEMEDYMRCMQKYRLDQERSALIKRRRDRLLSLYRKCRRADAPTAGADIRPGPLEFLALDHIKALIYDESTEDLELAKVSEIRKQLSTWCSEWSSQTMANVVVDFTKRGIVGRNGVSPSIDQLLLATCVVECVSKGRRRPNIRHVLHWEQPPMFYPEFLHHRCNWMTFEVDDDSFLADEDSTLTRLPRFRRRELWSTNGLVFSDKGSKAAERIVEVCGKDPMTATVYEMDALDARLVCLKCSYGNKCDGERIMVARTWRESVIHCLEVHWGTKVDWERISEADVVKAKEKEANAEFSQTKKPNDRIFGCTECLGSANDSKRMNIAEVANHLDLKHDIFTLEVGLNYYDALEEPQAQPPAVKIVPSALPIVET